MKIYARKQVGELSYFCNSWNTLLSILRYGQIYTSKTNEKTFDGKKVPYVSLSRNLTAAPKRNKKKWYVGVILDGNILSDKYKIEPYSFAYQTMSGKTGKFAKVKELAIYDNGSCYLAIVLGGITRKLKISKPMYNKIKAEILNMPKSDTDKYRLEYEEGKRRSKYGLKMEGYKFNTPTGGLKLDLNNFSEFSNEFANNPNMSETEERIWVNSNYIIVYNCIEGIIIPKDEKEAFLNGKEEVYVDVKTMLDDFYRPWKLITY